MKLWSCFFVTVTGLCLLAAAGPVRAVEDGDLERLLDAIAEVESNNEAKAIGDGGRAVGTYQIHRRYWADGTRFLGVDWKYQEARNPQKARAVVRAYLRHYGRSRSLVELARIHNGGPRGYRKADTLDYARKIKGILQNTTQALGPAGTSPNTDPSPQAEPSSAPEPLARETRGPATAYLSTGELMMAWVCRRAAASRANASYSAAPRLPGA